jgi:hypothetical protein
MVSAKLLDDSPELPSPLKWSVCWRLTHSLLCVIGGMAFLLGTIMYFPFIEKHTRGAGLFSIGGGCFFIADSMDLYMAIREALVRDSPLYEQSLQKFAYDQQIFSYYWEVVINSFVGATGSLSYLIGCVLFIPALHHVIVGDVMFVPGSVLIMISQAWRVYRTGSSTTINNETAVPEQGYAESGFSVTRLVRADRWLVCADISLGLGATAFLIGSVLFLPRYDTDNAVTTDGVYAFIVGSVLFIATGVCIFGRYFLPCGSAHEGYASLQV